MKIKIDEKEIKNIIKIEINNKMIDFETKKESFFYYFSDIGNGISKIIIEND